MNFKTFGLNALAVSAVAVGLTVSAPSAQAGTLDGNGTFNLVGNSSVTDITDSQFKLNFQNMGVVTGPDTRTGIFADLSGSPLSLASLNLVKQLDGTFNTVGATPFIQGLSLGGAGLIFNLDPAVFTATGDVTESSYNLVANLAGKFVNSSSGSVVGQGTLGAVRFTSGNPGTSNLQFQVTAVPTPALLPGLIALGAGVLRKRKAEAVES